MLTDDARQIPAAIHNFLMGMLQGPCILCPTTGCYCWLWTAYYSS